VRKRVLTNVLRHAKETVGQTGNAIEEVEVVGTMLKSVGQKKLKSGAELLLAGGPKREVGLSLLSTKKELPNILRKTEGLMPLSKGGCGMIRTSKGRGDARCKRGGCKGDGRGE